MGRCSLLVVAALLVGGCAHVNHAALATSTATLLCDWGYTNREASNGWRYMFEVNPVLGRSPDPGIVAIYFSTIIVANVVAYYVTPAKYRSAIPVAITARESLAISRNAGETDTICGL